MKAIGYHNYGSLDVLKFEEIDRPIPGDEEVLIRVLAASVNPLDWHLVRGRPYFLRMMTGLRKPRSPRLGGDVAGRVEEVGKDVTEFRAGDPVFGTCNGSFAEYACAAQSRVARRPDGMSVEEAATIGIAGLTALQGLRDKARLQAGQHALINGASGGVGTFAVQIARSFGAKVTGICSSRNVEMVRSLGADYVIDYTKEDFTRLGTRYDVLLDCVGNHPLSECRRVLSSDGRYVMVGGPDSGWALGLIADLALMRVWTALTSQKLGMILGVVTREDLTTVGEMVEAGTVKPVIDRSCSFEQIPDAIRYVEEGHARGKIVMTFET